MSGGVGGSRRAITVTRPDHVRLLLYLSVERCLRAWRPGNSSLPFFWIPKKFPEFDPELLNCPEGKRFALFQTRIAVINQLQSALMTGAHQRLIFPKLQGVE